MNATNSAPPSMANEDGLVGPDASDGPVLFDEIDVSDDAAVWMRQFVNRWVLLPHQRPDALRELRELLECHIATANDKKKSTGNGIETTAPDSNAVRAASDSPTQRIAATNAPLFGK